MNPMQVAGRLREQLARFSGIFSPRFSKPQAAFIQEMIYGIQASQQVKVSCIGRALGEEIDLKKTEERLSRHLKVPGMAQIINEQIAEQAAPRIRADTLIVVDPTDIRKTYAEHMEYLATVRDGSSKERGMGYWACVAVACEPERRRVIPLHQRLWSAEAADFESENTELMKVIDTIRVPTEGRGIYVMDRGGDRINLLNPLLDRKLRFIIRLRGDRDLVCGRTVKRAEEWGRSCPLRYAESVIKEELETEKKLALEYGMRPVKLPEREEQLYLVVVRGFGEEPLLLLTNVALQPTRKSQWSIVQGYLCRWLVEETIRFIKQSYHVEDLRVMKYERMRNLVALVLAAVYFTAVWLGEKLKLAVLRNRVAQVAKRFFGVPDFHYYALADGVSTLFSRLGRWRGARDGPERRIHDAQLSLFATP